MSSDNGKIPPHDIDAEMAVIGLAINHPEYLAEIRTILSGPDDFYDMTMRRCYEILCSTTDSDDIQIVGEAYVMHITDTLCGNDSNGFSRERLTEAVTIGDWIPTNIAFYAQKVKNLAIRRKLLHDSYLMQDASINQSRTVEELLSQNIESAERIRDDFVKAESRSHQAADLIPGLLEKIWTESSDSGSTLPTGLIDLDMQIGGFNRSELVIIAGRPATGKTSLAFSMIANWCKRGLTGKLFTLELSAEPAISWLALHCNDDLTSDALKPSIRSKNHAIKMGFIAALAIVESWNLEIHDGLTRITDIAANVESDPNIDFVIVDYLQLAEPPMLRRNASEQEEVSAISRSLKRMTQRTGIPIIALSQFSREIEKRGDKTPKLSDLRSSGAIEQDADVVLFPYRRCMFEQGAPVNEATIVIGKRRGGQIGSVQIAFLASRMRFENLSHQTEFEMGPF